MSALPVQVQILERAEELTELRPVDYEERWYLTDQGIAFRATVRAGSAATKRYEPLVTINTSHLIARSLFEQAKFDVSIIWRNVRVDMLDKLKAMTPEQFATSVTLSDE